MQKKINKDLKKGQALFGGSFDPIHFGHIAIAQAVLDLEFINEVVFIPNAVSPLKTHNPLASKAYRKEMVLSAIENINGFSLDDAELRSGGISYTIDTVERYWESSDIDLYFILGADQFHQLLNWYKLETLINGVKFLVYPRKGYPIETAPVISSKVIDYEVLNLPYWDMSSTKIRKLCTEGESIENFVPPNVKDFIEKHQIYQIPK